MNYFAAIITVFMTLVSCKSTGPDTSPSQAAGVNSNSQPQRQQGHSNCDRFRAGMLNNFYAEFDLNLEQSVFSFIRSKNPPNGILSEFDIHQLRGWRPGDVFNPGAHVIATTTFRFQNIVGGCGIVPAVSDGTSTFRFDDVAFSRSGKLIAFTIKGFSRRFKRPVQVNYQFLQQN